MTTLDNYWQELWSEISKVCPYPDNTPLLDCVRYMRLQIEDLRKGNLEMQRQIENLENTAWEKSER